MTKKKNNKDKRYIIQIYFANKLMSLDFEFDNYTAFKENKDLLNDGIAENLLITIEFTVINATKICYYKTKIVNKYDK